MICNVTLVTEIKASMKQMSAEKKQMFTDLYYCISYK